jgi:hypothetical protein
LTAKDKHILFEKLDLSLLLPQNRAPQVSKLWKQFNDLFKLINTSKILNETQIKDIEVIKFTSQNFIKLMYICIYFFFKKKKKGFEFLKTLKTPHSGNRKEESFCEGLYPDATITPYMHALVFHVPDQLCFTQSLGIPLCQFSSSGVEKKHHLQTSIFFRKTQKNGAVKISALHQILQTENRSLFKKPELKQTKIVNFFKKSKK